MKVAMALAPSVASSKTFSKVSIGTFESICKGNSERHGYGITLLADQNSLE
jgi:hypothetical protein